MNSYTQVAILCFIAGLLGFGMSFVIPFPYGIIPSILMGAAIGHFGYKYLNQKS